MLNPVSHDRSFTNETLFPSRSKRNSEMPSDLCFLVFSLYSSSSVSPLSDPWHTQVLSALFSPLQAQLADGQVRNCLNNLRSIMNLLLVDGLSFFVFVDFGLPESEAA